jgi:hypothetical protein
MLFIYGYLCSGVSTTHLLSEHIRILDAQMRRRATQRVLGGHCRSLCRRVSYKHSRARICNPFKEPRNRFPAWQAGTTTLFVVPAHHLATSHITWLHNVYRYGLRFYLWPASALRYGSDSGNGKWFMGWTVYTVPSYWVGNLSPALGRGIDSRNRVWNWVAKLQYIGWRADTTTLCLPGSYSPHSGT